LCKESLKYVKSLVYFKVESTVAVLVFYYTVSVAWLVQKMSSE